MDLTFSKFFTPAESNSSPQKESKSAISKTLENSRNTNVEKRVNAANVTHANNDKHNVSLTQVVESGEAVIKNNLGDSQMLSHRNEVKNAEPTSYPKSVDANRSFPQANTETNSTPKATIGPKIRFKGELVGEEDLLVHGTVEGTIDLKGHNLTVGQEGVLQANVSAKTVTIEGRVEGDVFGEERITIRSSSNVQGNIKAERVVLEDGAKFRGSIDMDVSSTANVQTPKPSAPVQEKKHAKEDTSK